MRTQRRKAVLAAAGAAVAIGVAAPLVLAQTDETPPGGYDINELSMADGVGGWRTDAVFTVGETVPGSGALNPSSAGDYTPPGVLDGIGAYRVSESTVRVFANHELLNDAGYGYEVSDGAGGRFGLAGARISYFDVDRTTRQVVDAGLAYDTIYDANGEVASDPSFLSNDFAGFSRFCSGSLFEAEQFGRGRGLADRIYFAGEEDGGSFNGVGGAEWALDPEAAALWQLPALGRGAWENITVIDTRNRKQVAILLADDTSPFDADGDGEDEAAPLYLYIGEKQPGGNFVERNGLSGGQLYVFVAKNGATTPADYNTKGRLFGRWVEIDNSPNLDEASEDGSTGYDEYGYPTQRTLWTRAEALGAFGFSRPEDVATNPYFGTQATLASTGVDSYVGGVDTFGTVYKVTTNFWRVGRLNAWLDIVYDGDADPARALRSPDNLDWADDGWIYVQEDEAEEFSPAGEPLFGAGAANPNEAGIVRMKPNGRRIERIANVNRGVVLDASVSNPTAAVDGDFGGAGEWETSGIVDVSKLFGERPGDLFLFDVQAHGIEDQGGGSRLVDGDLVEGGQLMFLEATD